MTDAFSQSDSQQVHLSEERETINRCRYSKDVRRTICQALPIVRLTHSPYTTKITRIRHDTKLRTIFKFEVSRCSSADTNTLPAEVNSCGALNSGFQPKSVIKDRMLFWKDGDGPQVNEETMRSEQQPLQDGLFRDHLGGAKASPTLVKSVERTTIHRERTGTRHKTYQVLETLSLNIGQIGPVFSGPGASACGASCSDQAAPVSVLSCTQSSGPLPPAQEFTNTRKERRE